MCQLMTKLVTGFVTFFSLKLFNCSCKLSLVVNWKHVTNEVVALHDQMMGCCVASPNLSSVGSMNLHVPLAKMQTHCIGFHATERAGTNEVMSLVSRHQHTTKPRNQPMKGQMTDFATPQCANAEQLLHRAFVVSGKTLNSLQVNPSGAPKACDKWTSCLTQPIWGCHALFPGLDNTGLHLSHSGMLTFSRWFSCQVSSECAKNK